MLTAGAAAPGIQLPDLNGSNWTLAEALKNGPVLLAFFKIACPTCQLTLPFLQRLADSESAATPHLVAVSQDDAAGTRGFHERFGISMPTVIDIPRTWPASNAYQIATVPSIFLIEPDGRISFAAEGFNRSGIRKLAERFLVEPFRENDLVPELRPG